MSFFLAILSISWVFQIFYCLYPAAAYYFTHVYIRHHAAARTEYSVHYTLHHQPPHRTVKNRLGASEEGKLVNRDKGRGSFFQEPPSSFAPRLTSPNTPTKTPQARRSSDSTPLLLTPTVDRAQCLSNSIAAASHGVRIRNGDILGHSLFP